jgi:hypothetical protein
MVSIGKQSSPCVIWYSKETGKKRDKWGIGVVGVRLRTSTATTPTVFCPSGTPILGTTAPFTTLTCPTATVATAADSTPWPARLQKLPSTPSPRNHPRHRHCQEPFLSTTLHPQSRPAALLTMTRWGLPTVATGSLHALTTHHALEGTIGPSFLNDVDKAAGGHI